MQKLIISIPVSDEYTVGDYADVYLDGEKVNRSPIAFFPGVPPHPGHLAGSHLTTPHLDTAPRVGHLGGAHLAGRHLGGTKVLTVITAPLYYGEHTVRVETFDYLGNPAPGDPLERMIVVDTGPTPPKNLRFQSQEGTGPVTFTFDPSVELMTP